MVKKRRAIRSPLGNMLAIIAGSSLILVAVVLFALWFLGVQNSSTTQKTAIEAAALIAANDIARIGIIDSRWGYVSLIADPPSGSNTEASDNYFSYVHGINELIGQTRLDCIIADALNDQEIKTLAQQDIDYLVSTTIPNLKGTIQQAMVPGGTAQDIDGNNIAPYDDAFNYYRKNQVAGTTIKAFNMTLGGINNGGVATAIPVPAPASNYATDIAAGSQVNGCYKSDTDFPYSGKHFIFGAISSKPTLVDNTRFTASVPNLTYQVPAAVQINTQQQFVQNQKTFSVSYAATASPGRAAHTPAPGALTFSFPDGTLPECTGPMSTVAFASTASANLQSSINGDFPTSPGSVLSAPTCSLPIGWVSTCSGQNLEELAIYDWLSQAGPAANVGSIATLFNGNWDAPGNGAASSVPATVQWWTQAPTAAANANVGSIGPGALPKTAISNLTAATTPLPGGIKYIYAFKADGTVDYSAQSMTPEPYLVVGEGQLYGECVSGNGTTGAGMKSKAQQIKLDMPTLYLPKGGTNPTTGGMTPPGGPPPGNGWGHDGGFACWGGGLDGGKGYGQNGNQNNQGNNNQGNGGPSPAGNGAPPPSYDPLTWTWVPTNGVSITITNQVDMYVRDYVRQPGATPSNNSGAHNGAPLDGEKFSMRWDGDLGSGGMGAGGAGYGLPPMVNMQYDFGLISAANPTYYGYSAGSHSARPTFATTGLVADIRFRRAVDIGVLSALLVTDPTTGATSPQGWVPYNSNTGYIGRILYNASGSGPTSSPPGTTLATPPGV